MCGMIVHERTVGQWDRHQRACNHRREEEPGRVGGQPRAEGAGAGPNPNHNPDPNPSPELEAGEFRVPEESWVLLMRIDGDELVNAPYATMRYIPEKAKEHYSECFNFAAREAVVEGDRGDRGMRLTLVVSAMLLLVARGRDESARVAVLRRCDQFRRGDWAGLLWWTGPEGRPTPFGWGRHPVSPEEQQARVRREVQRLMEEGQIGKATDRVKPVPMAPPTEATFRELERLCPEADPRFPRVRHEVGAAPLQISREMFDEYVQVLPRGRASGPSGLKHSHLQCVVDTLGGDVLFDLLNSILRGGVPPDLRPYFAGARLFALSKGGGKVRPIACGEVLRRMAASLAAKALSSEVADVLASGPLRGVPSPVQLGVGVPGGTDIAVLALTVALENNPDWVVCTVDWTNAFQCVSRSKILDEVADKFPQLYPFALVCYGSDPRMWFGVQEAGGYRLRVILSQEGVQQGDPMGPFFFAVVLHLVLREVMRQHPGLTMLPSFLDDTEIPGPPQVVAAAFRTMVEQGKLLAGLDVNPDKCEVYPSSATADLSVFPESVRGARGPPLKGFVALGSPVGDRAYVSEQLQRMAGDALDILPSLSALASPQLSQLALSFCVHPRVVHLLRTCEPELTRPVLQEFHGRIMDSLAGPEAAVMKGPRLDELAELMVSLPQRFGGAGFTRGERVADAAFLASFALIWAQVLRLFPGVITSGMLTDAVPGVGRLGEVKRARERLVQEEEEVHALVGGIDVLPAGVTRGRIDIPTFEEMVQGPIKGLQRRLASIPSTLDSLRLRARALQSDPRTRAWYHSVASADSVACDFWRVVPSYQAMQVPPAHFSIAARSYLLQSQPVFEGLRLCRGCQGEVDVEGMHFLSCRPLKEWGLGNPFSAVHDSLVREVASALRKVYPGSGKVRVEVRTWCALPEHVATGQTSRSLTTTDKMVS